MQFILINLQTELKKNTWKRLVHGGTLDADRKKITFGKLQRSVHKIILEVTKIFPTFLLPLLLESCY